MLKLKLIKKLKQSWKSIRWCCSCFSADNELVRGQPPWVRCPWCPWGQQAKALWRICLGLAVSQQGERKFCSLQLLQWPDPAKNSGKCPKPALRLCALPTLLTHWNLYYFVSNMSARVCPLTECAPCGRLNRVRVKTWRSFPQEKIEHGEYLMRDDSDFNSYIAFEYWLRY